MTGVKYICPVCNRPYKTVQGIENHMAAKHPEHFGVFYREPEPEEVSPPGDPGQGAEYTPIEPFPVPEVESMPKGGSEEGNGDLTYDVKGKGERPVRETSASPGSEGAPPDPVAATMQLALQNTQLLNVLMGDKGNPGLMAVLQHEVRSLREQLTTTREPGGNPLAQLNQPENKWLQDILKDAATGVRAWATGADSRDEAFLKYLGDDAKKLIMDNVKLEREAFRSFIEAAKKGDIRFGSDADTE